jgi:methylmalonyl-CoA/ethylmalonyl-CoA epimerase
LTALGAIGQVATPVHDIDRATTFYRDVLGLPVLFSAPPQLAFFDCGGVRLMLTVPETPEFDHPGSTLYFRVADIELACRELAGRGARFRGCPECVAHLPTMSCGSRPSTISKGTRWHS